MTQIRHSEKVFCMKVFLIVLILILNLQTFSKADDIRDFEIAGISIGDSLLDFYSVEQILNQKKIGFLYPNKKYFTARLKNNNGNLYEYLQFQIKDNDPKYIIYSIEGINFPEDINSCLNEQNNISSEIKKIFPSAKKIINNGKHDGDPNGKSMAYEIYYSLKNEGMIVIACYDWSAEITADPSKKWIDNLKVIIDSKEFSNWLNNEAYN